MSCVEKRERKEKLCFVIKFYNYCVTRRMFKQKGGKVSEFNFLVISTIPAFTAISTDVTYPQILTEFISFASLLTIVEAALFANLIRCHFKLPKRRWKNL